MSLESNHAAKTNLPLSRGQIHCLNETLTRAVYTNVLKPGDHVLDLGASIGDHTRELVKLVGPNGLVHAFEPNVQHYPKLSSIENTRLWPFAVGDEFQLEQLYIPQGLDGWASLQDIREELKTRNFDVQTVVQVRIDELSEINLGKVIFAKIDVEHRELQALSGMSKLLARRRAVLVVENVTQEIESLCAAEHYIRVEMHPDLPLANSILAPDTMPLDSFTPNATQIAEAIKITLSLQGS